MILGTKARHFIFIFIFSFSFFFLFLKPRIAGAQVGTEEGDMYKCSTAYSTEYLMSYEGPSSPKTPLPRPGLCSTHP